MADEDKGKGKDGDGAGDGQDQDGDGQGQTQSDPEILNRASLYGWVPKEDFKGDPKKWVPADQYVQRAEDILPISRAMNRKLEGDLKVTKAELENMKKTVKAVIQAHKKNADSTYEGRMTQIKKEQRAAVSSGDTETWAQLEEEKTKLVKPDEIPVDEGSGGDAAGANPIVVQWKKDNPWYDSDPDLGTYADSVSNFITARTPNLPADEFLERVKNEVKKRFPEKFSNPRRGNPPSVDRSNFGGGSDGGGGGGKTWSDLPADAKAACAELVKQKVLTKEQYLKTYFEEA